MTKVNLNQLSSMNPKSNFNNSSQKKNELDR